MDTNDTPNPGLDCSPDLARALEAWAVRVAGGDESALIAALTAARRLARLAAATESWLEATAASTAIAAPGESPLKRKA